MRYGGLLDILPSLTDVAPAAQQPPVDCQEQGCKLEWQPEFKLLAARSKVIVEKLLNELNAVGLTYPDFERLVTERGLKAS